MAQIQQNIGEQVVNLENDISSLRSNVFESLIMGDSMFGTAGHIDIRNEVKSRNQKLKEEYNKIRDDIDKKEYEKSIFSLCSFIFRLNKFKKRLQN